MERYIAIGFCTFAIIVMAIVMYRREVLTRSGLVVILSACLIVGGFMMATLRI